MILIFKIRNVGTVKSAQEGTCIGTKSSINRMNALLNICFCNRYYLVALAVLLAFSIVVRSCWIRLVRFCRIALVLCMLTFTTFPSGFAISHDKHILMAKVV
jgi:hypothetical protein